MSNTYDAYLRRHNGTDYDIVRPKTTWANIIDHPTTYTASQITAGVFDIARIPDLSGVEGIPYKASHQGYTSGATWYFPLATLPVDNSDNYCSLLINGRIGGWVKTNMANWNIMLSNRDNNTGDNIFSAVQGFAYSSLASATSCSDIVIYKQTDKSAKVYIKVYYYYTFDFVYYKYQSTLTNDYDDTYITTTPSGTLIWSLSSANKVEVYHDGSLKAQTLYEGGTALASKYLQIANLTASAIITALGTTAVNRATADASGNTITSTYLTQASAASTYAPISHTHAASDVTALITVNTTSGAKSLTGANNNEYRYTYSSGITSLTLSSITTPSVSAEFAFTVVFKSGSTATTLTNTLGAYFTGDDCSSGTFTPVSSATYDMAIWWNGIAWEGVVRSA